MRAVAALLPAVVLAGCAQQIAESRVRSALIEAGVSSDNSACMAARMVDRLSIGQLRELEALKARPGEPARPLTLGEYIERVRRVGDAEVVSVTASSAGLCAIGLG